MGIVKLHEKVIDGDLYKTKTLSATEGLDLAQELSRLLADGLVDLLAQDPEKFDTAKMLADPLTLGVLLAKSAQKAPKGELSTLAKTIFRHTLIRNAQADTDLPLSTVFDHHFAGRYMHMLAVIGWVVSVSFGGS